MKYDIAQNRRTKYTQKIPLKFTKYSGLEHEFWMRKPQKISSFSKNKYGLCQNWVTEPFSRQQNPDTATKSQLNRSWFKDEGHLKSFPEKQLTKSLQVCSKGGNSMLNRDDINKGVSC